MTISYSLAPNPKWYFADLTGKPLGAGSLFSYSNLDKTAFKFIFQDPAGNFPYPDPILIDENGTTGPLYFEFDTANPQDTYYLEVYDVNGNLQWTIDNFSPPTGGGGSVITTGVNLTNLVVNNVLWRNSGAKAGPLPVYFMVAPGAHAGLALTTVQSAANIQAGPDIVFVKNNTNAVDNITFPIFTLGTQPLTGDVAPPVYLRYMCDNTPTGETIKCFQWPITKNVQNLTNITVTVTLWAFLPTNSGANTITLNWYQFFGDGVGASTPTITPIQTLTLTSAWQKFVVQVSVPDITGSIIGACGNDGLFLQVSMPLNAVCDIGFTKPFVCLGTITPTADYITNDMIDAVINSPRTGFIQMSYGDPGFTDVPPGWVYMNDGTIGSATSGATSLASIETFPLYNMLWNNVSDTYAPVTGGRGVSSVADFTANKALTLTRQLGRVLAAAGQGSGLANYTLGEFLGAETHVLSIAEMPAHTHPGSLIGSSTDTNAGAFVQRSNVDNANLSVTVASQGGGAAHNIIQPTVFTNVYIKL